MKGPVSEGCQPCQWTGLQPSRWSHFLLETAGSVKFGLAYKTSSNLARLSLSGKKKKAIPHKRGKLYSEKAKECQEYEP